MKTLVASHPTTRAEINRAYRRLIKGLPTVQSEVNPDDNLVAACLMLASSVIFRHIQDTTEHDICTLEAEIAQFRARVEQAWRDQEAEEDELNMCTTPGCKNRNDDGEGWNGKCGDCADRRRGR